MEIQYCNIIYGMNISLSDARKPIEGYEDVDNNGDYTKLENSMVIYLLANVKYRSQLVLIY